MKLNKPLPGHGRVHVAFGPGDTLALWSRGEATSIVVSSLRPRQRAVERLRLDLHECFAALHATELAEGGSTAAPAAAARAMNVEAPQLQQRRERVLNAMNGYCACVARAVARCKPPDGDWLDLVFLRDAHAVAELFRVVFLEETDGESVAAEQRLSARLLAWLADHYFAEGLQRIAAAAAQQQRGGAQRAEQTREYWALVRAHVQCGQPERAVALLAVHSAIALLAAGRSSSAPDLDMFAAPPSGGLAPNSIEDLHGLLVESPLPSASLYSVRTGRQGTGAPRLYTPAKVRAPRVAGGGGRGGGGRGGAPGRAVAVDDTVEVETPTGWKTGILVSDRAPVEAIVARYEEKRESWRKRCAMLRRTTRDARADAEQRGERNTFIHVEVEAILTIMIDGGKAAPRGAAEGGLASVGGSTDLQRDLRGSAALLRLAAQLRYACPYVEKADFAAKPPGRSRRGSAPDAPGRAAALACAAAEPTSDIEWIVGALSGSVDEIAVHCSKQYDDTFAAPSPAAASGGAAHSSKRRQWPWVLAHLFDLAVTDGTAVVGGARDGASARGGARSAVRRHRARLQQSRMLDYIKSLAHLDHASHGGRVAAVMADYVRVHAEVEAAAAAAQARARSGSGAGGEVDEMGRGQPHRAAGLLEGYVARECLSGATVQRVDCGKEVLALCRSATLDLAHVAASLESALCASAARRGGAGALVADDLVSMRGAANAAAAAAAAAGGASAPRTLRAVLTSALDACFDDGARWLPIDAAGLGDVVDGVDELVAPEGQGVVLERVRNARFAAVEGLLLCARQTVGLARTLADVEATGAEQSARARFVRAEAGRRVAELILSEHTPARYGPRLLHFAKELIDLAPGAFTSSELCALLRAAHAVQGRGDYDDAELVALRTTLAERLAMAAVLLW